MAKNQHLATHKALINPNGKLPGAKKPAKASSKPRHTENPSTENPTTGSQNADTLDAFLATMDDPANWRSFVDPKTGKNIILTPEEIEIIRGLRDGVFASPGYNPYEPAVDFFTYKQLPGPVVNRPEPKRRFAPSKWEALKVARLVKAIRKGWIKPAQKTDPTSQTRFYDIWERDDKISLLTDYIAAPRIKLPEHAESYNPPKEYLPTEEERAAFEAVPIEERPPAAFLSASYDSLRKVPSYPRFIQERFSRCLDLYMCAREIKHRIRMDPDDLLPVLPDPKDLRPFPTSRSLDIVVSDDCEGSVINDTSLPKIADLSIDPNGQFIATVSGEGVIKIWEISTGKCIRTLNFGTTTSLSIAWNPAKSNLLAVGINEFVHVLNLKEEEEDEEEHEGGIENGKVAGKHQETWTRGQHANLSQKFWTIKHSAKISKIVWHRKGDYFAVLSPNQHQKTSVTIHQYTKRVSQHPFTKLPGIPVSISFHPTRPHFILATRQAVRIYDLKSLSMVKKLIPVGVRSITAMDIHQATGDHIVISSLEQQVAWFDLDYSLRPYRTMQPHRGPIRDVALHKSFPLLATASDDGTVQVMHARVHDDLSQNVLLVPVKILDVAGNAKPETEKKANIRVTRCIFHPNQPWLFCATSDGKLSLWV